VTAPASVTPSLARKLIGSARTPVSPQRWAAAVVGAGVACSRGDGEQQRCEQPLPARHGPIVAQAALMFAACPSRSFIKFVRRECRSAGP
jgi:hypothetical protein